MTLGYDQPLYILPFDHRHSYGAEVFGFHEPMTRDQIAVIAASKRVIYRGFEMAVAAGVRKDRAGILVDEEFGADILRDSVAAGYITCMPTEKSGQHEFDFEFGDDFASHIEAFNPTFVKVLVRYNPDDDQELNRRQLERLARLSVYCREHSRRFMFEMLVPGTPAQLAQVEGDKPRYDIELRPKLMVDSIREIQDAGVEPDVWKIEGLDRREDCELVVEAAHRRGRSSVGLIVLGRGEDEAKVIEWLQTAAAVNGFIGFAVGRSTFLDPIIAYRAGKLTDEAASAEIARRYREWVSVFERARSGTNH